MNTNYSQHTDIFNEFKLQFRQIYQESVREYVRALLAPPKNWRWWHRYAAHPQVPTHAPAPCVQPAQRVRRALHGANPLEAARHVRRAALQRLRMVAA